MCPRCGAHEGTCGCSLTDMGGQVDHLSAVIADPGVSAPAPLATDERAALLEFLRDFSSAAPASYAEQPVTSLNEAAAWPLAPEDDPSFDPAGAAASRAFLSRFAAAASAQQTTSFVAAASDQFWEPDLTGTASGLAGPLSTTDEPGPAAAALAGPPTGNGPPLNRPVASSPGAGVPHDPFFALATHRASGGVARAASPNGGAPGPGRPQLRPCPAG